MGKKDMKKCAILLGIIKKAHDKGGPIHEFDLIDEAEMEVASFNSIKAYFIHKYDEHVVYDKKTKSWSVLVVPVEPQKKLDDLVGN